MQTFYDLLTFRKAIKIGKTAHNIKKLTLHLKWSVSGEKKERVHSTCKMYNAHGQFEQNIWISLHIKQCCVLSILETPNRPTNLE